MKIPFRTASKIIDLANLKPDDIDIKDIARALSGINRYNGVTRPLYTVAQHSVLCSFVAPAEYKLAVLLHDGHEAYTGDITRPVNRMATWISHGYNAIDTIKAVVDHAVEMKFGIEYPFEHPEISTIDSRMLATEMLYLFGENYTDFEPYSGLIESHGVWSPQHAEEVFLYEFERLVVK